MGMVGVYWIALAGFPKGECGTRENRVLQKKQNLYIIGYSKENQQKFEFIWFFMYIEVSLKEI